jgi:hypothetical protein
LRSLETLEFKPWALLQTFGAQFQPDPCPPECSSYDKEGPIARFVAQMNRHVRKVGLVCYSPASTYFMSPHGMGNDLNVSCALDIARFSREAMRNRLFKKIVKSTKYTAEANKKVGSLAAIIHSLISHPLIF